MRCDLFCAVIDNYGDAGVCWRLARQWAREHGFAVRLWIDDVARLMRIAPEVDPEAKVQQVQGVELRAWRGDVTGVEPGEVVVEAFACELPPSFLEAMAHGKHVWINLEYLSAEGWVGEHHALPSPHPRLPLTKYFYFPGFDENTGGLLREARLAERRAAFLACRTSVDALWSELGLDPTAHARRISVFSYDNPAIEGLCAALAEGDEPTALIVPLGTSSYTRSLRDAVGAVESRGALQIWHAPFVDQERYDRLLWACDFNFVRGEDSFVRAQHAARPLAWQIYPQTEDTHWTKLRAWEERYQRDLSPPVAQAWRQLSHAWNRAASDETRHAWRALEPVLPALQTHAEAWSGRLAAQTDLAAGLARFCAAKLQ